MKVKGLWGMTNTDNALMEHVPRCNRRQGLAKIPRSKCVMHEISQRICYSLNQIFVQLGCGLASRNGH